MKKTTLFLFCFVLTIQLYSQSIIGHWTGELSVSTIKLPLVIHITQQGDSLRSTMDSPSQGAKGIPVSSTTFAHNQLQLSISSMKVDYKGLLAGDSITGTFTQMGNSLPLVLKKQSQEQATKDFYNRPQNPKPPYPYNIEDVTLLNSEQGNKLAGTLTTPKDKTAFPVVVMITGSGAQNRDEEMLGHKPFLIIADYFTRHGIGVLRMDDRGMGDSEVGKAGATSADFASDISSAVTYLKQKGFLQIGLVGHSEGGMIAPIVATQNKDVDFIVSMAGPGIPIDKLMKLQVYEVGKSQGMSKGELRNSVKSAGKLYKYIIKYKGTNLKADLSALIRKKISHSPMGKKLTEQEKEKAINEQVNSITSPWYQYFLKYKPDEYWSRLTIPVLAINGTKDVQVIAMPNLDGIAKSLRKANNKHFKTLAITNLNHLFQQAGTGGPDEYAKIEQTIDPAVLEIMSSWILELNK